jgi:hypothetical protein
MRLVTAPEGDNVGARVESMPPRQSMQLPSPDCGLCCGEDACCSCVQPSGQHMPSIAIRDAKTTITTTATTLRTS